MTNFLKSNKSYFWISVAATIILIGLSLYKFYFQKSFLYVVEVSCDPSTEECAHRNCEEEDCPVNGLEDYLTYSIKASDFDKCKNEDCTDYCKSSGECQLVKE